MRTPSLTLAASAALLLLGAAIAGPGCRNRSDDCELNPLIDCETGSGGATTSTSTSTTTSVGGGSSVGGGGSGGATGCATDADCISALAAKCDPVTSACVACDASPQCAGISGTEVCATEGAMAGSCVECTATEGCGGGSETCNLLESTCAAIAPGSLDTCEACSNDGQCPANHRCVPMDYPAGTFHGHYCLKLTPTCLEPLTVSGNATSLNGEAVEYCGLDEDRATCEAVNALLDNWRCTGTDGMCSEMMGGTEVAVPGALCRDLDNGNLPNRCTYGCGAAASCPDVPPLNTCGGSGMGGNDPDWCGG